MKSDIQFEVFSRNSSEKFISIFVIFFLIMLHFTIFFSSVYANSDSFTLMWSYDFGDEYRSADYFGRGITHHINPSLLVRIIDLYPPHYR